MSDARSLPKEERSKRKEIKKQKEALKKIEDKKKRVVDEVNKKMKIEEKNKLKEKQDEVKNEIDNKYETQLKELKKKDKEGYEVLKEVIKKEIKESKNNLKPKYEEKDTIKYVDFKYIQEVPLEELLSLNPVFVDAGKRSLFYMRNKDGIIYNYTNSTRLYYSKRLKYQNRIEKAKNNLGIVELETQLSSFTSKSVNLDKFIAYCNKTFELYDILLKKYEYEVFRKYKWYNYIQKKRAENKMLYEMKQHFGKNATFIIGDASIGINMRNFISTPNIALKRKIKEQFNGLYIDEFRSSCINHFTNKLKVGHLKYFAPASKTEPTLKSRDLHSVLTYQMENKRIGCINRDLNAVYNLEILYNHYIKFLQGVEKEERPLVYIN